MDMSNAWEQLVALRELTRRTGTLHEAQVLQLKMWPRLFYQASTASEFSVSIAEKHVSFKVQNGKPFKPKANEVVIRERDAGPALADCVKKLLGGDWRVTIAVTPLKGKAKSFEYPPDKVAKK